MRLAAYVFHLVAHCNFSSDRVGLPIQLTGKLAELCPGQDFEDMVSHISLLGDYFSYGNAVHSMTTIRQTLHAKDLVSSVCLSLLDPFTAGPDLGLHNL